MTERYDSYNLDQLTDIRDVEINKNLKMGQYNEQYVKNLKNNILYSDYGLVSFINKKYGNFSEKEKLIREINLIKFETSVKNILDPSGEYFLISNQIFEINQFLLNHGRDGNVFSYDNVKYLINNIEDLSNYVDFDVNDIAVDLTPITNTIISIEEKKDLTEIFKKQSENDKLNVKIRNSIKSILIVETEIKENELQTTPAEYRTKALAYARKHGYTNGYYGSKDETNNAPAPYYNFQKNGYGDCANFVSQCLHEGGVQFWTTGSDDNRKWYWYNLNNRSPSWAGAREFKIHWVNRVDYQTLTVNNTLSYLRPATPLSLCREGGIAYHTMIATDKHSDGKNFSYAAHTDGQPRTNLLSKVNHNLISYYKVYW